MTGLYKEGMKDAWLEADRLGFDTAWGHDHLLSQNAGESRRRCNHALTKAGRLKARSTQR